MRMFRYVSLLVLLAAFVACTDVPSTQTFTSKSFPPAPAGLDLKMSTYLEAAKAHPQHVWRDTEPRNPDGSVNGYVEIPKGESTKWEFRIPLNRREVDRMIPPNLGGYPTNYGFVPRTISYDGDPADVLVLGPALPGGEVVKGRIVGLMEMVDTGDLDSKVVVTPIGGSYALDAGERSRLEQFFNTYKNHDGKVTKITGWGSESDAIGFLERTAGFFKSAPR
jgi:inorganic pyrophosphatase